MGRGGERENNLKYFTQIGSFMGQSFKGGCKMAYSWRTMFVVSLAVLMDSNVVWIRSPKKFLIHVLRVFQTVAKIFVLINELGISSLTCVEWSF